MLTKFRSADELASELENSKFPLIGIPYTWTFGGLVKIDAREPNILIIKDKKYHIIKNITDMKIVIIATMGT